jgi:hypothetical protein
LLDDDQVADVQQELARIREEWRAEHGVAVPQGFGVVHRGGTWTRKHRGVVWDSTRAYARGKKSEEFCRKYNLNLSRTYSRFEYGDSMAALLALHWSNTLQYFWSVWVRSGSQFDFVFEAHMRPPVDNAFEARVAEHAATSDVGIAARQIAGLRPRRM